MGVNVVASVMDVMVNVPVHVIIFVRPVVLVPPVQEILYFYYYINTFND